MCSYKSSAEAARDVNGNKAHITACCKNKRNSHAGFLWSYTKTVDTSLKKSSKIKIIYEFTLSGEIIKKWNCMDDILVANPSFNRDRITDCCNFYSPSAYGSLWSYSDTIVLKEDKRSSKNKRIPIKHNDVNYKSFYEASKKENVSPNKIRKMILENIDGWSYNETN